MLLTDGRNEHDRPGELEDALTACAGRFTCDARGIGDQWAATELREIATRLHGVADAVEDHSDLEAEFRTMMTSAMGKALPDIRIRVRLREGSELRFLKQVFPTELDLTAEGVRAEESVWEFPTGAWGDEARDFHLCVTADPAGDPRGEDLQLASVTLVAGDQQPGTATPRIALPRPSPLLVHWTDDPVLSTRVHPRVAHYGGHADLGRAVVAGCEAYERGERATAEAEWGRAVRLAGELRDEKMLRRLGRLVTVTDLPPGRSASAPTSRTATSTRCGSRPTTAPGGRRRRNAHSPPSGRYRSSARPRTGRARGAARLGRGDSVCTQCGHRFATAPAAPPGPPA
ncbi:hypothetical protein ACFQ2B_12655 [Streptomyces stramineus]